jgi:hypothetical protein
VSRSPEERARSATAADLADTFCRWSRRAIAARFDRLFDNDDTDTYRTAQRVMANEMRWLEEGVPTTDVSGPTTAEQSGTVRTA